jgi:SAM-dependent methyltransferase
MTEEKRATPPAGRINQYDENLTDEQIAAGAHRKRVGADWNRLGALQFDYLRSKGLLPSSYLLDVGCGAMRGGLHFARYLDPGHYYGVDVNESLIRAARSRELPDAGLADRVPEANLRVTDRFDVDFGRRFDYALAVSLFSHLPLNHIKLCLYRLSQVMAPQGRFYATFFEAPRRTRYDAPVTQRTGKHSKTYPERDPFCYRRGELEWAARSVGPWQVRYIGDWGHPRGQQMMEFRLRDQSRPAPLLYQLLRRASRQVRRRLG